MRDTGGAGEVQARCRCVARHRARACCCACSEVGVPVKRSWNVPGLSLPLPSELERKWTYTSPSSSWVTVETFTSEASLSKAYDLRSAALICTSSW